MHSESLNNNQTAGSSSGEPASRLNIREDLAGDWDTELLFLSEEEFDEAIIGVAERIGDEPVVAYDTTKIVEILSRSMSVDEAYEFFEFNILGAYVGEKTPLFITTVFKQ
jgi:hypothetical protein